MEIPFDLYRRHHGEDIQKFAEEAKHDVGEPKQEQRAESYPQPIHAADTLAHGLQLRQ